MPCLLCLLVSLLSGSVRSGAEPISALNHRPRGKSGILAKPVSKLSLISYACFVHLPGLTRALLCSAPPITLVNAVSFASVC
ncbi:hypothetical protein LZ31DRAFT_555288 [Colletotrichum somersetense]|nr:hypothetical protein LZ31DRAFT_555288 [Colletotrichum somersetense]